MDSAETHDAAPDEHQRARPVQEDRLARVPGTVQVGAAFRPWRASRRCRPHTAGCVLSGIRVVVHSVISTRASCRDVTQDAASAQQGWLYFALLDAEQAGEDDCPAYIASSFKNLDLAARIPLLDTNKSQPDTRERIVYNIRVLCSYVKR